MSAPPPYSEPAKQGYPPSQPGYGGPPPQQGYPAPQQGYPAPQQGYPAPQQGYAPPQQGYAYPPPPTNTVTVVGVGGVSGGCPSCHNGVFVDHYGCCAIFMAIFFFPIGILCCLAMKDRQCTNCGYISG